ncbi:MAG: hypothetical protein HPY82_01550 [Gammaproteobacteria bacterium]|nr:hypothetical protein [Gammaproteobacteria bacterium]
MYPSVKKAVVTPYSASRPQHPLMQARASFTAARKVAAITLGTLMLSACVEALWSSSYSEEGADGTLANVVVPGPGDSVLLAGNVILPGDPQTLLLRGDPFIARHSAQGELLWRYRPQDGTSFVGATSLDTAPDGSIYFTDMRESDLVLTKLDADGNRLWEYRRPQVDDLFNAGLALLTKTVGTDLVLMGVTRQADETDPPGTLVALDRQGQVLWEFNGIGSGAFDQSVRFTAGILADGRIATFYSWSEWDAAGRSGGVITVLDTAGNTLATADQATLGLNRIFDLVAAGENIAVVGRTEQGSRLLVLGRDMDVLLQRDFGDSNTARLATQDDTLCFALLTVNDPVTDFVERGITTLGIIDHSGRATWETTLTDYNSRSASLTADNHRCAYSDMTLLPPDGYQDASRIQTRTQIYSAQGVLDTVTVPGDPGIANVGHALLRGQALYTAANTTQPLSEYLEQTPTATLYKHRVY